MKWIASVDDTFMIVIPQNFYFSDKSITMKKIKDFILTYNKIYHFLNPGFYQVDVFFHDVIGTILEVEKLDVFEFGDKCVDLRIVLSGRMEVGFILDDFLYPFSKVYLYQDKIYLLSMKDIRKHFYELLEHGEMVFKDKINEVKRKGRLLSFEGVTQ